MPTTRTNTVLRHLQKAALLPSGAGLTDGQLLERFLSQRDEAAFEALVRRHGPMVMGVCKRVIGNLHDAEDAFQASFLVLARKAASVSPREAVGNWLYGVAYRTARRANAVGARRRAHEKQVKDMPQPTTEAPDPLRELEPLLDQELSRLPDKYRLPLVLCELEGRPRKDVARQLKLPEGTLSSRLATARKMLAARLARHGQALSGGLLATLLSQSAVSASVPSALVTSTAKAASVFAAGQVAPAGVVSAKVVALTKGVLNTMLLTKLKIATAVVLMVGLLGGGASVLAPALWGKGQARAMDATPGEPQVKEQGNPEPREKAARGSQPDELRPLIDKVIKAHGGEAKLNQVKAFTLKTKHTGPDGGAPYTETLHVELPDKYRLEKEAERQGVTDKTIFAMNGDKLWRKQDNESEAVDVPKEGYSYLQGSLQYLGPRGRLILKDQATTLSPLGESKVGERAVVGLKFTRKGMPEAKLFFDKETGLMLKTENSSKDKDGKESVHEVLYSDHKDFDGIPIARKVTRKQDGKVTQESEVVEFRVLDKLDAKLFQKP